jgi:hypothetical protein
MADGTSDNYGGATRGILRRVVRITAWAVVLLIFVALWLRLPELSGEISVDNPRRDLAEPPEIDESTLPRVMRYLSEIDRWQGKICFGLVLESEQGEPRTVLNLTALHPELGSTFYSFCEHDGFALADAAWAKTSGGTLPDVVESLAAKDLARRVAPPVDISLDELNNEQRFVIGVGFNYADHRDEAKGESVDRLAFAKHVSPTGAYETVALGPWDGIIGGRARLTDYETEFAFVLLEDVDLSNPPTSREIFSSRIAWLTANDVSDRRPIVLDGDAGFTRAKSRPT